MISSQSHIFLCNSRMIVHITVKIVFCFTPFNYLTVTGTMHVITYTNIELKKIQNVYHQLFKLAIHSHSSKLYQLMTHVAITNFT